MFIFLDYGNEAGSVHSVAEALLLVLDSTPEPIIPFNLHEMCLNSSSNYIQCKQVSFSLARVLIIYMYVFTGFDNRTGLLFFTYVIEFLSCSTIFHLFHCKENLSQINRQLKFNDDD